MRFHAQNLNEKGGDVVGPMFFQGRCWLYLTKRLQLSAEWCLGKHARSLHLTLLSIGGEYGDVGCSISIPYLFSLYLHVSGLFHYGSLPRDGGSRDLGITIHEEFIWIFFFHAGMADWIKRSSWFHPGKRRISIDWKKLLLGKVKFTERLIRTEEVEIPLPEGTIRGKVDFNESRWERPRWFPLVLVRANIAPEKPIPVPGKGENSWDCDDDAIYSMSCVASTSSAAVSAIVESALRSRERHGGRNWRPAA